MMSTFAPIILFAGAIWGAYACAGFYGVAIAASAMMATTGVVVSLATSRTLRHSILTKETSCARIQLRILPTTIEDWILWAQM